MNRILKQRSVQISRQKSFLLTARAHSTVHRVDPAMAKMMPAPSAATYPSEYRRP
ncbi:MAG TPA: hypothetical protein PKE26_00470 [Kiritimatiellia bacterium]|nr:hypothetical protein [Kiritimatiellia bacterium]HMO97567.1 hypothetical protein [Kiritimatiellia bacterium]HMP95947.1 hypothetical protein [Kiritimatiellia bacterium]